MPIEIPGKSISPPDVKAGAVCPRCGRFIAIPKKVMNPKTKTVKLVCPYCGKEL